MTESSNFNRFLEKAHRVAKKFYEQFHKEPFLIISHIDADGISSAAIMSLALKKLGIKHVVRFVPVLKEETLKEISQDNYKVVVFLDLGSGILDLISKYLHDKEVFILDHHLIQKEFSVMPNNINIINHREFDLGENFASASTTTWLFAKILGIDDALCYVNAMVGATGDLQYSESSSVFEGLNKIVLDEGIARKIFEIKRDLNVVGKETKPINEFAASINYKFKEENEREINFEELGIELKRNGKWRVFEDLTEKEKNIFLSFMEERLGLNIQDLLENEIYIKAKIFPIKNLKELVGIINGTGKQGKAWLGFYILIGLKGHLLNAIEMLNQYRQEIAQALELIKRWPETSDKIDLLEGEEFIIVNFKNAIAPTLVGTIMSIALFTKLFNKNIFIGLARDDDKYVKVSVRTRAEGLNAREIISAIVKALGRGEFGGHKNAAGAVIFLEDENKFIEEAKHYIEMLSLEESI